MIIKYYYNPYSFILLSKFITNSTLNNINKKKILVNLSSSILKLTLFSKLFLNIEHFWINNLTKSYFYNLLNLYINHYNFNLFDYKVLHKDNLTFYVRPVRLLHYNFLDKSLNQIFFVTLLYNFYVFNTYKNKIFFSYSFFLYNSNLNFMIYFNQYFFKIYSY